MNVLKDFLFGLYIVIMASLVALAFVIAWVAGWMVVGVIVENGLSALRVTTVTVAVVCTWAVGRMARRQWRNR